MMALATLAAIDPKGPQSQSLAETCSKTKLQL
jgi:hypothetical protein